MSRTLDSHCLVGLCAGLCECEDTPSDLGAGKVVRRSDFEEDHVAGNSRDGHDGIVYRAHVGVLISGDVKVLLHSRHVRIVEITLINILEPPAYGESCEHEAVELEDEATLGGRFVVVVTGSGQLSLQLRLEDDVLVPDKGDERLEPASLSWAMRHGHCVLGDIGHNSRIDWRQLDGLSDTGHGAGQDGGL